MHLDIEIFKEYAVVLKSSSGNDGLYNWNYISKWINSKILIIPQNVLRQNLFQFRKCFHFLVRQKRHNLKSNSNFPQGLKEKTLVISCLFSSNHLVSSFFFFFATECKKKKKKVDLHKENILLSNGCPQTFRRTLPPIHSLQYYTPFHSVRVFLS